MPARQTTVLNALMFPGSLLALAAVVITNSFVPLLVFAVLFCLAVGQVIWLAPMLPISEALAASNKRWGNAVVLFVALGIALWWWRSHA